jgi:bifunctional DNA-binding transcriptional regulator/antitoxin component of YhaV-PrlF toxin-antitoxin module
MTIAYATIKAKGRIVVPLDIRIEEGTRVAFLEQEGRILIQPLTDAFIESMKGVLAGAGFPTESSGQRPASTMKTLAQCP